MWDDEESPLEAMGSCLFIEGSVVFFKTIFVLPFSAESSVSLLGIKSYCTFASEFQFKDGSPTDRNFKFLTKNKEGFV